MATVGDLRPTSMTFYGAIGVAADRWRGYLDRFHSAYTAELTSFTACVRAGATPKGPARTPGPPWPSRWERSVRSTLDAPQHLGQLAS